MAEPRPPQSGAVRDTDIAIVGMACHVPGATTWREYWANLTAGVESIRRFTPDELRKAGVPEHHLSDPHYVPAGVVLDGMERFDAEFFGFSPKEAAIMDPQHRHFLEVCWEALEDAGHPPERFGGAIGVFAGCGMGAYFAFNLLTNPELVESVGLFLLRHTGNDKDFLSTRVSYCLDLKGPSINVQTACSTSLVAVHAASQSLLSGECDLALAGGVTIELPHGRGYHFQEGEILSPDGHCRAFDHRARGTIFGSGAGVVALRRLADALEDGDHVYAVIRGTAINNDGSSKVGYLAPSVAGQAAAVAEAIAIADVSAESIGYIECHGTGTAMGDPIEVAALTKAFHETTKKRGFCGLGSVKTNIGHLDTAAGVAALIKAALALHRRQIPPSLNYEKPNPEIDFAASPFYVNDKLADWPAGKEPRRAGVNSLGVGGTNAHAILEEAPAQLPSAPSAQAAQILCFSAKSRAALDEYGAKLARYLREHPSASLADVGWTLAVGRRAFEQRRVLAAQSAEEAARLLENPDPQRLFTHAAARGKASVAFLLPGGGAQHPLMGRGLYDSEPVYRKAMDEGLELLKSRRGLDLRPYLFAPAEKLESVARELERPALQLPAIFLVEYALAQSWISRGVEPTALLGHSMGENTAACLAGTFTLGDALGLVALRGELFERVDPGGMLSVPLPAEELEPLLEGELDLAVRNSPSLSVASGSVAALEALERRLLERGVEAKKIPISIAAHSRMLAPILGGFRAYLNGLRLSPPRIPFLSNVTGTWITAEEATDPEYWVRHLTSCVRFGDGVAALAADKERVLLEVGPGRTLSSLAKTHPALGPGRTVLSSLRHPDEPTPDATFFAGVLGRLWASGALPDLEAYWKGETRQRLSLPTYAFQRQRFWIEPGKGANETARPVRLLREESLERWLWRESWRREDAPAAAVAGATSEKQTWLVFLDEAGVCAELAQRLERRGDTVVLVRESDSYRRENDRRYWLSPEHGRDGYTALVRDLVASGTVPTRVLHGWMLTQSESFRPGSSFFHRNQERGFYSLFFLAQAIGEENLTGPLHIDVLSNGMQQVEDEALPYPDKATLLGPLKVIPREYPGVSARSIDLALPGQGQAKAHKREARARAVSLLADQLERELASTPGNACVALRGERRFVQAYERAGELLAASSSAPASANGHGAGLGPSLVRQGGTYLITGGLGGIGLSIAEHLARTAKAKLVLLGRGSLPDRSEWSAWAKRGQAGGRTAARVAKLLELESLGASVLVASADVTDVLAMEDVLDDARKRFGPIHGVVHAAGLLGDGPLQAKTQTDAEDVFAPKIQGTLVLDGLLRAEADTEPLDFLVLCSSTSVAQAPAGQADYVAANAFLDAFARHRGNTAKTKVMALAWGIWNEVGMANEVGAHLGRPATQPTVREEALDHPLFARRLSGADAAVELCGDWTVQSQWMLDQHRTLAGHAVLPGTGTIEVARAALVQAGELAGGAESFEIHDLYFFKALSLADDETRAVRARLTRNVEGYAFDLQSKVSAADGKVGWQTHAQAALRLTALPPPPQLDLAALEQRCSQRPLEDPRGIATGQETHLRFGPRWRVLRKLTFGQGEALAQLELPTAYRAEAKTFRLHPSLLDLATGCAMELIEDYHSARGLWVPVSYASIKVHAPLEPEITSHVRVRGRPRGDGEVASFDVTIASREGRVLVEVENFTIRRLAGQVDFALATRPAAAELELESAALSGPLSPAELAFQHNLRQGILPAEGAQAFERLLRKNAPAHLYVTSLPLDGLIQEAGQSQETKRTDGLQLERPAAAGDYVAPRDDIEKSIAGFWQELLGVSQVGVTDGFFDLGGHSLVAVRLFARIKRAFQVDLPMSVLFEAPTVEACAKLIRERTGATVAASGPTATTASAKPRYLHLVPMSSGRAAAGPPRAPFFLVAGMFGNVLNLRHLAQLVSSERPIFGLQARGLYGEHKPHETFEEMARDYLAELRTIQPHGPYYLGGFSGGGLTAYEMAQQLRAQGEEVPLLLLLDTPLPKSEPLTARDKAMIHWQRLQRSKHNYLLDWAKSRLRWEFKRFRERFLAEPVALEPTEFHNSEIEAAFRRALERYEVKPYGGKLTLFRPKLDESHPLGEGRVASAQRVIVRPDNGWSPYAPFVEVHEVPGDHDSMVLEPNVRVLATRLRRILQQVERQAAADSRLAS
jgi:acyl transferase domain-containing protein